VGGKIRKKINKRINIANVCQTFVFAKQIYQLIRNNQTITTDETELETTESEWM
jgi:hypothetical protein